MKLSSFPLLFVFAYMSAATLSGYEVPEDHAVNGYETFFQLKEKEAKEYGGSLASSDYKKGIKRILVFGLRKGTSEFEESLAEKYKVYHVAVAGCVVTGGIIEGSKAYNDRMKKLLLETYEKDIFEEVRLEIEMKKSEPAGTGQPH